MHTLEEDIVSKVRCEVDSVMTTVETRIQDTVLAAIKKLNIPRVELAMKSANASAARCVGGNVLEPGHRGFSGSVEGLQMTASSRIPSRTDFSKIHETRGVISIEEGDLLVNEKNDRQTRSHHSRFISILVRRGKNKKVERSFVS